MAWSVTNIGTGSGGAVASITVTSPGTPLSALILVAAFDFGGTPGATAVSDTKGNSYRRLVSFGNLGIYFCASAKATTGADSFTYTKFDAVNGALVTICYATNALGALADLRTIVTASGTSTTPSVTSNAAADAGELFFGVVGNGLGGATFAQDAGNGWAAPPNDTGGFGGLNLAGGFKVNSGKTAQTFSPTLSIADNWQIAILSFTIANSDWNRGLTEPIRLRPRSAAALDLFNRNNAWYNLASQKLTGWYQPLSEPVRSKPPLPRAAIPHFFSIINHVEFHFLITETGDVATMTFAEYMKKDLARVTITELQTYPTQVTIKERNYSRGYS